MPHPEIELIPVESSQLHSIGHDAATDTLAIRFKGKNGPGSLYHYANFTTDDFGAFMAADSKGSFFKRQIKPAAEKYPYTKVDEAAIAAPTVETLAPERVDAADEAKVRAEVDPAEAT